MKPVSVAKDEGLHSAPTIPMKSVPAFLAEQAPAAPSAPPAKPVVVEKIPRPPPPPAAEAQRPAPRPPPPPAAPPRPAARAEPVSNPSFSTDMQLKMNSLHKMAEQAQQERTNAKLRKVAPRSTRSLPVVRSGALGVGMLIPQEMIVEAPLQSYPGQRTASHSLEVINQYVVAANARYLPPSGEDSEMGHLFVFDVMCSMHTSLERAFPGSRPGTFRTGTQAEMWKWMKETALSRGWRVVEGSALLGATTRGLPVIAMANTPNGPRLAVVEPLPPGNDGQLRLASAYEPRGQRQKPDQVFGSSVVRYLAHD
jgi:hypothetical protein